MYIHICTHNMGILLRRGQCNTSYGVVHHTVIHHMVQCTIRWIIGGGASISNLKTHVIASICTHIYTRGVHHAVGNKGQ